MSESCAKVLSPPLSVLLSMEKSRSEVSLLLIFSADKFFLTEVSGELSQSLCYVAESHLSSSSGLGTCYVKLLGDISRMFGGVAECIAVIISKALLGFLQIWGVGNQVVNIKNRTGIFLRS